MENITFKMLWSIVWRRKFLIAFLSLAVGIPVFCVNYFVLPKRWRSEGSFMFTTKTQLPSRFGVGTVSEFMSNTALSGSDYNFAAILQSRLINERVYSNPKILKQYKQMPMYRKMPLYKIVATQKDMLEAKVENKLITMSFEGPTPQLAADVINQYLDELVFFLVKAKRNINHDQREFLEKQIPQTKAKLEQLEELIRDHEKLNPMLMTKSADQIMARYSMLNTDKDRAVMELAQFENARGGNADIESLTESAEQINDLMLGDPTINLLRAKLAEYQLELSQKSEILDDAHPTIIKLQEQVGSVRREIRGELAKRYNGKKEYLDSLQGIIDDYDRELTGFPDLKMQYTQLVRDQMILEQLYSMQLAEYENARVDEKRTDESITILDRGNVPYKKCYPKTVSNSVIFTIAAGAFFSYVFIMLDIRKLSPAA